MKKRAPIVLCSLVFMIGLAVMLYPTVSNLIYEKTASYVISDYLKNASTKTKDEAQELFLKARQYNETLTGDIKSFMIAAENEKNNVRNELYFNSFDDINGIIGLILIDNIDIKLPVYLGTDESILQKGVGHLEGSSLPTGDINEHIVLTGHTGLPEAKLFTDLTKLSLGDEFSLEVLDKTFVYEIYDINVVLPSEVELLKVKEGKNVVTLVTCTPYGINSHRLLVTAELKDTIDITYETQETSENTTIKAYNPLLSIPMLTAICVILLGIFIATIRKIKKNKNL